MVSILFGTVINWNHNRDTMKIFRYENAIHGYEQNIDAIKAEDTTMTLH